MDLPIQFPSDADVAYEEARRFRALSDRERARSIRGLLRGGERMIRHSAKAAFLRSYSIEQEELARTNVREFIARHAR